MHLGFNARKNGYWTQRAITTKSRRKPHALDGARAGVGPFLGWAIVAHLVVGLIWTLTAPHGEAIEPQAVDQSIEPSPKVVEVTLAELPNSSERSGGNPGSGNLHPAPVSINRPVSAGRPLSPRPIQTHSKPPKSEEGSIGETERGRPTEEEDWPRVLPRSSHGPSAGGAGPKEEALILGTGGGSYHYGSSESGGGSAWAARYMMLNRCVREQFHGSKTVRTPSGKTCTYVYGTGWDCPGLDLQAEADMVLAAQCRWD